MATGINTDKVSTLKLDLIGYTESINKLVARLNNCKLSIQTNIEGAGKAEMIKKIDKIIGQMPTVNYNINSYIGTINKLVKSYELRDIDSAKQITKDITKLDKN